MSDGRVKHRECEVAECYNQPQGRTNRCLFHPLDTLCGDHLVPVKECGCLK